MQQVTFEIKNNDDGSQDISLKFEPPLVGSKSEKFEAMTEDDRALQNTAALVGESVMKALKEV
jgi:hypothetical protein